MFCWFCSRTSKQIIYTQQFWCVWVENGHIGRKYTDQRKFLTHPRVKQKCLLQFGRIVNQLSRESWLVRFFKTYCIYSKLHENMIFLNYIYLWKSFFFSLIVEKIFFKISWTWSENQIINFEYIKAFPAYYYIENMIRVHGKIKRCPQKLLLNFRTFWIEF